MRGSDVDAALYWLARMVEAGEDPLFIARRLVITAAEDVGLADPTALQLAVAAQQAVHFLGMPEGRLALAEATVYLARAPKSNASYMALNRAQELVRERGILTPPGELRSAAYAGARKLGRGNGYLYPHENPEGFAFDCLPEPIRGKVLFTPSGNGVEQAKPRGAN